MICVCVQSSCVFDYFIFMSDSLFDLIYTYIPSLPSPPLLLSPGTLSLPLSLSLPPSLSLSLSQDEEGWEYLEEDQALYNYKIPSEVRL